MITQLIKIGHSRGIRIPEAVLEQTGLNDQVEIEVEGGQLIIRPAHATRKGWKEAFRQMADNGDDKLIDKELLNQQSSWDEIKRKW